MSPGSCSSDRPQTPKLKTRKQTKCHLVVTSDRTSNTKTQNKKTDEMSPGSCSSDRPQTPKLKTRKQTKCHLVVALLTDLKHQNSKQENTKCHQVVALLTDLEHQNSKQENRRNVTW